MARKVPTIPTPPGTKSPVPGLDRLRRRPPGSRIEETISEETEEKRERRTRQIPGLPGVVTPPPGAVITRTRLGGPLPDIRFEEPPDELREEEPAEPLEAEAPPDPSTWVWKDTLKYAFLKGLISQEQLTNFSAALSTVAAGEDWNIAPSLTYPSGAGVLPAWQALLTRVLGMVGTEYGREARNALAAIFGGSNLPQMPDLPPPLVEPITEEDEVLPEEGGIPPEEGGIPPTELDRIQQEAAAFLLGPNWQKKFGGRFTAVELLRTANANDFARLYKAYEGGHLTFAQLQDTLGTWKSVVGENAVLPMPAEEFPEARRALVLAGLWQEPTAPVQVPTTTAQAGGPELLAEYQTALDYASKGPILGWNQTLDEKIAAIQTWQAERSTIVSLDTPPPGIEYDAINKVFVNQATGGDLTPEQYRLLGQWERAQRVDEQMTSLLSALLQSYGRLQENQLLMQQDQDALTNALKTGEIDSAAEMQFRLDEARLQNERLEQSRWALEVTLAIMRDPQTWYMAKEMGLLQYLMGQVQGLPGMGSFSLEPPPKASRVTVLRMLPGADIRREMTESEWQAALYAIAAATGWTANDLVGLLERHKPGSLGPGAATPIFRTREARP